jgi:amino acid adenylation domain-containing protein
MPTRVSIADDFRRQAASTPDRVAVVHGGVHATYREIDRRVRVMVERLASLGAGRASRIAVEADPSIDTFVAVLAVWELGATCVPLDAHMTRQRRQRVMEDSAASVLIFGNGSAERFSHSNQRNGSSDASAGRTSSASSSSSSPASSEHACILYTSGVTGRPKGVIVTHAALANHIAWMREHHPLRDTDVALLYRPITLIAAVWDHFGPLLQGVPVVVEYDGPRVDPLRVVATSARWSVTHISGVPSFWRAVASIPAAQREGWTTLRLAISSGEGLETDVLRVWRERFGGATLLNVYGLTECCRPVVFDTTELVLDGDGDSDRGRSDRGDSDRYPHERGGSDRVPVGRPIADATIGIFDERLRPVPAGVVGEICVAGSCLAAGYLDQPTLTAARFVPSLLPHPHPHQQLHPQHESGGEATIMFRTGDLGRQHADGTLVLSGRGDEQVKIRGYRVETAEVAAALRDHPSVAQAAVVVNAGPAHDAQLVAFLVSSGDAMPSADLLRSHLSARLPDYMVPASFITIATLPLTASGKVDRGRLAEIESPHALDAGPRTATEQTFARILGEATSAPDWSLDGSFLQLGGHSLMAMQVVARVMDEFGVELDFDILFEPDITLRAIAARIADRTLS